MKFKHSGPPYTTAFKADAVRRVLDDGQTIAVVAREVGVSPSTLRRWVEQAGREPANTTKHVDPKLNDVASGTGRRDAAGTALGPIGGTHASFTAAAALRGTTGNVNPFEAAGNSATFAGARTFATVADTQSGLSYKELRALWAETARDAAKLDPFNRALVFNYLGSAALYTARVVSIQADDPDAAKDAELFAKHMAGQDNLRKAHNVGKLAWRASGFGAIPFMAGASGAILEFLNATRVAGAQVDWTPVLTALSGSTGLAYYLLVRAAQAGPAVGNAIAEAWTELLASADPAKHLVSSKLDAFERRFYGKLGVSVPSKGALNTAGPVFAVLVMASIAIPLALLGYFIYSGLSATITQPSPYTF